MTCPTVAVQYLISIVILPDDFATSVALIQWLDHHVLADVQSD